MTLTAQLFKRLVGDDAGHDSALPDAQREALPHNFFAYVGSHVLTKLGDALTNPKTTLTWMAGALGVAGWMAALLVPLRESGSMLLQIWVAGGVQRFSLRKRAWSVGAVAQAASMCGMALCALWLRGMVAGVVLLALLAVFALARSISSVASKDVLGRVMPKGQRGRASGWAAGAAGVATLVVGAAGTLLGPSRLGPTGYALLLAGAGLLWLIAAAWFMTTREPQADARPEGSAMRLRMLFTDRPLRQFVLARALLMCTALSAPYYVIIAQRQLGHAPRVLAAFIVAEGLASMLGGPVWGRLADRSSRRVMMVGGLVGGGLAAALAAVWVLHGIVLRQVWVMPLLFFVLSLAHQAVRTGRKTYVVDMAQGDTRTDYVAVSNSAMGVLLLLAGGAAAALSAVSVAAVLGMLALMGLSGVLACGYLPEVE